MINFIEMEKKLNNSLICKRFDDEKEVVKFIKQLFPTILGDFYIKNEEDLIEDYEMTVAIYKNYGYIDIYYFKSINSILITEIAVNEE